MMSMRNLRLPNARGSFTRYADFPYILALCMTGKNNFAFCIAQNPVHVGRFVVESCL